MTAANHTHITRAVRLDMAAFARAIEAQRARDEITLTALADRLGMTGPTFTRIRRAARAEPYDGEDPEAYRTRIAYRPDVESFLSICAWLRVNPGEFGRDTQ